jgi:hypothetical protein
VGFTKKQCRDQKQYQFNQRRLPKKAPKQGPKQKPTSLSVMVKVIWTTPAGEQHLEQNLISVPQSTALDLLRQQIQDEREEQAKGERAGWSVTVEIFDADHMPSEILPL